MNDAERADDIGRAIDELMGALTKDDDDAFEAACHRLVALGPESLPLVRARFEEAGQPGWSALSELLPGFGVRAAPFMAACLEDPDAPLWLLRTIVRHMKEFPATWSSEGSVEVVAPALVRLLDRLPRAGGDTETSSEAYDEEAELLSTLAFDARRLLAGHGSAATETVMPALLAFFRSQCAHDSYEATWIFRELSHWGTAALPLAELAATFVDEGVFDFPEVVVDAVGRAGSGSIELLPHFGRWLAHENPEVRAAAAEALRGWGELAEPLVPDLALLIHDDDAQVRHDAARTLIGLGAVDETVVRVVFTEEAPDQRETDWMLAPVLRDDHHWKLVLRLLTEMDASDASVVVGIAAEHAPTRVRPALERMAAGSVEHRRLVSRHVRRGQRLEAWGVSLLEQQLSDDSEKVRAAAAVSLLWELEGRHPAAMAVMTALNDASDEQVRTAAEEALERWPGTAEGDRPYRGPRSDEVDRRDWYSPTDDPGALANIVREVADAAIAGHRGASPALDHLIERLLAGGFPRSVDPRWFSTVDGGRDAMVAMLRELKTRGPLSAWEANRVLAVLRELGPRAGEFEHWLVPDAGGPTGRTQFAAEFHWLAGEFDEYAALVSDDHADARRLLPLDAARADALLILCGRGVDADAASWSASDADLVAASIERRLEDAGGDGYAGERLLGAAVVLRHLPPAVAWDVADELLSTAGDSEVRALVAESVGALAESSGVDVPRPVLAALLDDPALARIAVRSLCAAHQNSAWLRDRLTQLAGDEIPGFRPTVLVAWMRRGGSSEVAAEQVRAALDACAGTLVSAHRTRVPDYPDQRAGAELIDWTHVREVLTAAKPAESDARLVLRVCHFGDRVELWSIVEHLGELGVSCVPRLRADLRYELSSEWKDANARAALRALAAIGVGARDAAGDIRRWRAENDDVDGLAATALRRVLGQ